MLSLTRRPQCACIKGRKKKGKRRGLSCLGVFDSYLEFGHLHNKLRALALTCYRFSSRAWYYIFLLNLISAKWRTRSQCDRINTRYWAMSIYKACPTSWMFRETVTWLSLKTCVQGGTLFPSTSIYFAGKKSWKSVVKTEWDHSSALLT